MNNYCFFWEKWRYCISHTHIYIGSDSDEIRVHEILCDHDPSSKNFDLPFDENPKADMTKSHGLLSHRSNFYPMHI